MSDILSVDHCRLLVQMLGHSLWQASVIAIVCWIVLRSLPARRSSLRYGVACAGLLSVVSSAFTTAVVLSEMHSPEVPQITEHTRLSFTSDPKFREWFQETVADASNESTHTQDAHGATPLTTHGPQSTTSEPVAGSGQSAFSWLTLLACLWAAGVLLMFGRVARQLLAVQRLRRPSGDCDSELLGQLQGIADDLTTRLKLWFPVRLVVSDRVSVPGMIGTFWPVLLLPPAMLSGVPIEQLRVVIAHELAHARRFDFLVNLGQLIVESLLFFNPAVWWLSRQIRIEREACCDAEAVTATGSAVPVARTLLAIVERLRSSIDVTAADRFAAAAGIQSMTGDGSSNDNSPLFDRVRRIVTPEQRPHVRVPWYTLVGVVVAYGLVSFGLYEGTAVTVQAVQRALTPKERVEKIEKLVAAKGELARSEGIQVRPGGSGSSVRPDDVPTGTAIISGTVRTADGSLIPPGLGLVAHYTHDYVGTGGRSGNAFNKNFKKAIAEHSFEVSMSYIIDEGLGRTSCYLYFNWRSDGTPKFAPLMAGPFELTSDGPPEKLDLVLQPGFSGGVQVVSESGVPVPNAFVSGYFRAGSARSAAMLRPSHSRTSSDGRLTIPHCSDTILWQAEIRAAGFQKEVQLLKLQPDEPVEVKLKAATPVTLKLTSAANGAPVSGARAFVIHEDGPESGRIHYDPRSTRQVDYESRYAPLHAYGPSNAAGELILDALADDIEYDLLVMAPGFGPARLEGVTDRQAEQQLTLSESLSVSGRIIGDLSTFRGDHKTGRKFFQYSHLNSMELFNAEIEEHGDEGLFQIDGLGLGRITLRLPGRTVKLNMKDSVGEFVIDLNEPEPLTATRISEPVLPEPEGASRRVILTLTGTEADVSVSVKLRIGYITRGTPDVYSSANLDIVDSKVEFDVEVPTKIHWTDRSFTGYSILGRTGVDVFPGNAPFRLDVALVPGGAVRGEVRLADGSLSRNFQVDLRPVDQNSKYKGTEEDVDPVDPPGEFVLTGVPFDQQFRLLVTDERIKSVAAIVSEPFSLTAAEPIADLKFQFEEGRTHVIQLRDEDGQPAHEAKAEFAFKPGDGWFTRSHGWQVNDGGQIVFQHVAESIPGEMTLQVKAAGPFRGQKLKLDWSKLPESLTLKRGVAASGRLVDEATGRGVAGASFFLFPSPSKAAEFQDAVWGKTDDEGRFSFECLEPINYQLNLYGAVPPRVPFKENARGVLEPDYSGIRDGRFPEWFVQGGSSEPVTIKVKLTPRSRLKLSEPEVGN